DFTLPSAGVPGLGGGTTAVTFSRGRFIGAEPTLGGTLTNCCGGPTTWGSWLTAEEEILRGSLIGAKDHGYIYEVPSPRLAPASATPIVDAGLMDHEACAVDPKTGDVYETEDNGPNSGFYRFRPLNTDPAIGALEQGGDLYMLKVAGAFNADLRGVEAGDVFDAEWVPIAQPDMDPEFLSSPAPGFPDISGSGRSGPYMQGEALGGARFSRLEGCWYKDGVIYFIDTNAGPVGKGTIWAYQPDIERLTVIYASPSEEAMDNPDNVTISPRGGMLICEDGGGLVNSGARVNGTRLVGIQPNGESFFFAENNMELFGVPRGQPQIPPDDYRGNEFAGACFDPTGRYLFVNIQTPGVTFAITGPWGRGGL
ncbi:MAG: alkaline phosphatase PhoX, partial [Pseudomonadota bacterium]